MDSQFGIQRGGILLLLRRDRIVDSQYAPAEISVELFVDDQRATTWRCSPSHLPELAAGWMLGEGVIASYGEIADISEREAQAGRTDMDAPAALICVRLAAGTPDRLDTSLRRPIPASTGARPETEVDWQRYDWRALYERMYADAPLRAAGGGVHTGALIRGSEILALDEDVGRHNVVDKLVGRALRDGVELAGSILLLSGRLSGSIAAKAARAGLAGLTSLSVPTSLAVRIASHSGLTLVGRVRRGVPLVYSPRAAPLDKQ